MANQSEDFVSQSSQPGPSHSRQSGSAASHSRQSGNTSSHSRHGEGSGGRHDPIDVESHLPKSLEHVLRVHASRLIDDSRHYKLEVDRSSKEKLWETALAFYKGAKSKPRKLQKEFVVDFVGTGEVGVDSGALRKEFFGGVLKEADARLFEGEPTRRIVNKDWGLELMYEVAGMMIAHSIFQEGPAFPCLSPSVYDYLVHEDPDQCYPVKDDIPLNLSTHEVISFIEKVCVCQTQLICILYLGLCFLFCKVMVCTNCCKGLCTC